MIQITRVLAKQLRAVLRKSVASGKAPLPVLFQAGRDGLRIRAQNTEAGVEYHLPGSPGADSLSLDFSVLEDFAGTTTALVTLEATSVDTVRARWDDGKVPKVKEYGRAAIDQVRELDLPKNWAPQDAHFLQALSDAAGSAATMSARYALTHLQLRGKEGKIVATDGRQLLTQGGFTFPWTEDVLVPVLPLFKTRLLSSETEIAMGRTKSHVCLRCGPWTFWLSVNNGSYPDVDSVIPAHRGPVSNVQLSASEADFLLQTLPRLPGGEAEDQPVTLDLTGHLAIRAKGDKGPITEVALPDSLARGPHVRTQVARECLVRALELGFREFTIVKDDSPIVCREDRRVYAWMSLGKKGALEPSTDAVLITPSGDEAPRQRAIQAKARPAATAPAVTSSPTITNPAKDEHTEQEPETAEERRTVLTPSTAIEEAETLKLALRDAYLRSGRLLASLKRQRKQSKLLTSTMTALRQLQHIA